jgi:hypothetical protein
MIVSSPAHHAETSSATSAPSRSRTTTTLTSSLGGSLALKVVVPNVPSTTMSKSAMSAKSKSRRLLQGRKSLTIIRMSMSRTLRSRSQMLSRRLLMNALREPVLFLAVFLLDMELELDLAQVCLYRR